LIFTTFLFLAFLKNILEYFPLISGVSTNESSSSHDQFAKVFVCVLTGICNYPYHKNMRKFTV